MSFNEMELRTIIVRGLEIFLDAVCIIDEVDRGNHIFHLDVFFMCIDITDKFSLKLSPPFDLSLISGSYLKKSNLSCINYSVIVRLCNLVFIKSLTNY